MNVLSCVLKLQISHLLCLNFYIYSWCSCLNAEGHKCVPVHQKTLVDLSLNNDDVYFVLLTHLTAVSLVLSWKSGKVWNKEVDEKSSFAVTKLTGVLLRSIDVAGDTALKPRLEGKSVNFRRARGECQEAGDKISPSRVLPITLRPFRSGDTEKQLLRPSSSSPTVVSSKNPTEWSEFYV